nr:ATP-binding cassette sub-family A member 3-like isoform X1 [Onthophagus taurus]XP_022908696.1 ATP-binding cassette sub-family A member 3-like isoform X2 [Onthophagus taurus]
MPSALYASLYKHCAIRKRQIVLTCFEVIVPILTIAFIVFARSQIPGFHKIYVNTTTWVDPIDEISLKSRLGIDELSIYYTPMNNFTFNLIRKMQLKLDLYNHHISGFPNQNILFNYYNKNPSTGTNVVIVFDDVNGPSVPKEFQYNLKIYKDFIEWNTDDLFIESNSYSPGTGSINYIENGFLPIQYAIELSFIEIVTGKPLDTQFKFEEFPYPPHSIDSGMNEVFIKALPLVTILSFLFICSSVLNNIVQEKSQGMKELMKINGLKNWSLFLGWFLNGFLLNLISIIAIIILLKCKLWEVKTAPLEHCHWLIIGLLLILYCSATISFFLMFSTLFNRATLASILSIVAWLAGFIIFTSIGHGALLKLGFKRLFVLLPNVALYYAYEIIAAFETREVSLNLANIFDSPSESSQDVSMGALLLYLLVETFIYFLLALYLDQILPGPYGISKPWHFLISEEILKKSNSVGNVASTSENSDAIEMLNVDNSNVMIRVYNLTKEYDNVTAVKKLNIDVYKGTVTSLLGRNGAGKTTTMSMMTGMIHPTSGDVFVDGVSILKHSEKARKLMSICPQHDLLFKELTVWQHLILFGLLRGSSKRDCELQAMDLLKNKLYLWEKQNELVSKLSGGMMRKVALGISLMGNPKLLILDEPTAGIDVEARREIWDLILSYKNSHTILLSTHFLEEADELSDRIAIMDRGTLVSYGTSMFLRNKYNVGYICTCVVVDETKIEGVVSAIKAFIPEATRLTQEDVMCKATSKDVVEFALPSNMKHKFHHLLAQIHGQKLELGIKSIKFSNTTLEDVVLKVMFGTQQDQSNSPKSVDNPDHGKSKNKAVDLATIDKPDFAKYREKFTAQAERATQNKQTKEVVTFIKKLWFLAKNHYNFLKKSYIYCFFMLLICFMFGAITMIASKMGQRNVSNDGTTFELSLAQYDNTHVYFSIDGAKDGRLSNVYHDVVASVGSIPLRVSSAIDEIVKMGIENIVFYKRWMIAATEFKLDNDEIKNVKVLYSNNAHHGAPISLNLATNTILKYITGDDEYWISALNTPLHSAKQSYIEVQQSSSANMLLWFFLLPLGPLFLMSTTLLYPTYMHLNEINVLQKLCGVPTWLYWIINYIVDFVLVSFSSLVLIAILLLVNINTKFATTHQTFELFSILVLYCTTNLPFGYLFTRMKSVETAIFRYVTFSLLLGIGFGAALLIAETIEATSLWTFIFECCVVLVPQASLTYLLGSFAVKVVEVHNWDIKSEDEVDYLCKLNHMPCCDPNSAECVAWKSAMTFGVDMIIAQLAISFMYFLILLIMYSGFGSDYIFDMLDTKLTPSCVSSFQERPQNSNDDTIGLQSVSVTNPVTIKSYKSSDDNTDNKDLQSVSVSDSLNVKIKPSKSGDNTDYPGNQTDKHLLKVKGISKKYLCSGWKFWKWHWIRPVTNLEFNVAKNECFGLLGVNGAGKTTTFRILTNTIKPSCGRIQYTGKQSRLIMGYCPQKSALIERFTVYELLETFANLSNAPVTKNDLEGLLAGCGLSNYINVPCGTLSGGNKRKLNMAVAFVANPELLLLDEPTTGVDLVARRELWRIIEMFKKNSSVILTSHSMEECEALCDKIAVMKSGTIKAMGKISDLKKEYCVGYIIKIEFQIMDKDDMGAHQDEVFKELYIEFGLGDERNVVEKERCFNTLQVQVKHSTWEDIFLFMERLKGRNHDLGISDYFVKEVSFEDVFLTIANTADLSV